MLSIDSIDSFKKVKKEVDNFSSSDSEEHIFFKIDYKG